MFAVFGTGDYPYLIKCIVSLRMFCNANPSFDAFLFTEGKKENLDAMTLEIASRLNIRLVFLELESDFHTVWQYPRECYYIFYGPEYLHEQGYDRAVYIDGDIVTNNSLPIDQIKGIEGFAGVARQTAKTFKPLALDLAAIKQLWPEVTESSLSKPLIQSAVVVFNTKAVAEYGFYSKVVELYNVSLQNGIPRKGDDSLLALFMIVYKDLPTHIIPYTFNAMIDVNCQNDADELSKKCFLFHAHRKKPWQAFDVNANSNKATIYFLRKWQSFLNQVLTKEELAFFFPELRTIT